MLHMCSNTIYKIEIFIYGSANTHWWHVYIYIHVCMGYIFAFVHRSTNWRMQHHGVFCTLSTVGLKSLLGLESIERVMPSGCMTGSWLYNDIRCNHVKGWNRTVLPSAGHPSGRPMSTASWIWMNSYGQNVNPKRLCCWIMALHALKHVWSQIDERYNSMCGCTVRWDMMGLIHESSHWRWQEEGKSGKPWESNQHVILTMSHRFVLGCHDKKSRRDGRIPNRQSTSFADVANIVMNFHIAISNSSSVDSDT